MDKIWTFNGNIMKYKTDAMVTGSAEPPGPSLPSDMHFLYLANDFSNGSIPNRATNSAMGSYIANGTITKNGSGSSCYLSNGLDDRNYLYINLGWNDLNLMKAESGTYTFYCRVMCPASTGTGGIFSWRMDGGYVYVWRSENHQLQFHDQNGGMTTWCPLTIDTVYKMVVSGWNVSVTDMNDQSNSWSDTGSGTKDMGLVMTTFAAYWEGSDEGYLDRMYALAGIARATTAAEDTAITNALMNQTV